MHYRPQQTSDIAKHSPGQSTLLAGHNGLSGKESKYSLVEVPINPAFQPNVVTGAKEYLVVKNQNEQELRQ